MTQFIGRKVKWRLEEYHSLVSEHREGEVVAESGIWLVIKARIPSETPHICPFTFKRVCDVAFLDEPDSSRGIMGRASQIIMDDPHADL